MPTENEMKFVIDVKCEDAIRKTACVVKDISQGYLFTSKGASLRIRRCRTRGTPRICYTMTYKSHTHVGRVVEIETTIEERDYEDLWPQCVQKLVKTRYGVNNRKEFWEVDFFRCHRDETYFALAEIEMPEGRLRPNEVPDFIRCNLLFEVPLTDCRFSSKLLADVRYASDLYNQVLKEKVPCNRPMI
jgi:CYTH domain-containing protein